MVFALVGDSTMTSAPFPLTVADALGFRTRFLGATARAMSVPSSAFFFTLRFLAATHQSFVKRRECASLPSRTRLRKPDDLIRNLRRRFPIGINLRVRAAIELVALSLQHPHARHRILS